MNKIEKKDISLDKNQNNFSNGDEIQASHIKTIESHTSFKQGEETGEDEDSKEGTTNSTLLKVAPKQFSEYLESSSNNDITYILGPIASGKTQAIMGWLQDTKNQVFYLNFYHKHLSSSFIQSITEILSTQALSLKNGSSENEQDHMKCPHKVIEVGCPPLTLSIFMTQKSSSAPPSTKTSSSTPLSEQRPLVIFDNFLCSEQNNHLFHQHLKSLLKQYRFCFLQPTTPYAGLLQTGFEYRSLFLTQANYSFGFDDLLRFNSLYQLNLTVKNIETLYSKTYLNNELLMSAIETLSKKPKKLSELPEDLDQSLEKKTRSISKNMLNMFSPEHGKIIIFLSKIGLFSTKLLESLFPTLNSYQFISTLNRHLFLNKNMNEHEQYYSIKPSISSIIRKTHCQKIPRDQLQKILEIYYEGGLIISAAKLLISQQANTDFFSDCLINKTNSSQLATLLSGLSTTEICLIPEEPILASNSVRDALLIRAVNQNDQVLIDRLRNLFPNHSYSTEEATTDNTKTITTAPPPSEAENFYKNNADTPTQVMRRFGNRKIDIPTSKEINAQELTQQQKPAFSLYLNKLLRTIFLYPETIDEKNSMIDLQPWMEAKGKYLLSLANAKITVTPISTELCAFIEKAILQASYDNEIESVLSGFTLFTVTCNRLGTYDIFSRLYRYLLDWCHNRKISNFLLSEHLTLIGFQFEHINLLSTTPENFFFEFSHITLQSSNPCLHYFFYQTLSQLYALKGDWERSNEFLEICSNHKKKISQPITKLVHNPQLQLLLNQILQNSIENLEYSLDDIIDDAYKNPYDKPIRLLLQSAYKLSISEFVHAEDLIIQAIDYCKKYNFLGDLPLLYCFYSQLLFQRGNTEKCITYFTLALDLTKTSKQICSYHIIGDNLFPIIDLINTTRHAEQLKRIKKVYKHLQKACSTEVDTLSKLSKREMEILILLNEGKSNEEISIELHRSVGTVKLHAHNIYKKLGVRNRVEAVNIYKTSLTD